MQTMKIEVLKISRRLNQQNQANLLTWVNLAYFAETSVKKTKKDKVSKNGSQLNTGVFL